MEWHLRKVFTKLGVSSRRELRTALPHSCPARRVGDKGTGQGIPRVRPGTPRRDCIPSGIDRCHITGESEMHTLTAQLARVTTRSSSAHDTERDPMSQLTTPNLTIDAANGTTYAYRRYGKAGTVPVVFFQHFRGNLDGWDPALVDDIAGEREVILFDASGVGLSTGSVPATFERFGRDALAFHRRIGAHRGRPLRLLDRRLRCLGGRLQRPHLMRRLILAGTGPEGGQEMHGRTAEPRAHAMKDVQGAEDILYLFFGPSESSPSKGKEFVGRIFTRTEGRDTLPTLAARDAQSAAAVEWGIRDFGKLSRLANITAPTLVANGDNDIMVPTVNSYLLAGHLPNARLSIYPDANHGFLFQYPHEFAVEVNSFLAEWVHDVTHHRADSAMERTTTAVNQDALGRAAAAHGVYEAEVLGGVHHVEWPAWNADHVARTLAEDGYQFVAVTAAVGAVPGR